MSYETDKPCVACKMEGEGYTCFHHLKSRKAYPEHAEKKWNMIPTCLICHQRYHNKGLVWMTDRHPAVKKWLVTNDWEYDSLLEKWQHEN